MIVPQFSNSLADIQSALGMADLSTKTRGFALLSQAVAEAKGELYVTFALTEMTRLKALSQQENPTTDDEYIRDSAKMLEVKLIKRNLLRSLGAIVPDGEQSTLEEWNEVSMMRGANSFQIRDELIRLDRDVAGLVKLIQGLVSAGDNVKGNYSSIQPDTKPSPIGSSIRPLTTAEYNAWSEA